MVGRAERVFELLAAHYVHAASRHGIDLDVTGGTVERAWRSFSTEGERRVPLVESARLSSDIRERSSRSRARRDLAWLSGEAPGANWPLVLDFGSGVDPHRALITSMTGSRRYVGVDPLVHPDGEVLFGSLEDALAHVPATGAGALVLARYVLHHLPAESHDSTLRRLLNFSGGKTDLLVVEDCIDAGVESRDCDECAERDAEFCRSSEEGRRLVVAVNDMWSNAVSYGESRSFLYNSFEVFDAWESRIATAGARIVASQRTGFDHDRMHGVPTLRVLAAMPGSPADLVRRESQEDD